MHHPQQYQQDANLSDKFTQLPKTYELINAGVRAELIPTYSALADYANNTTGECWPKMETLARTLRRSVRTVQRHIHELAELGIVELVERRRKHGRYASYRYRLPHIARAARRIAERKERNRRRYEEEKAKRQREREERRRWRSRKTSTTGHGHPASSNKGRTSTENHLSPNPKEEKKSLTRGYESWFGLDPDPEAEAQRRENQRIRREAEAERRKGGGYDWWFGR